MGRTSLEVAIRNRIFRRDRGFCARCGADCEKVKRVYWRILDSDAQSFYGSVVRFSETSRYWEVDHIREVAEQGITEDSNLQTLCRKCHQEKTSAFMYRRNGRSGGPKVQFNCRLPEEVLALINSEVERLQGETEKKVSQADVVSMAMVKWCSVGEDKVTVIHGTEITELRGLPMDAPEVRRVAAEAAMRDAESKPPPIPAAKPNPRSESVAQRNERESKEHAAKLAESDTVARMVGRGDIEYDLENAPHRSAPPLGIQTKDGKPPEPVIQQYRGSRTRKVTPLTRPHGSTEPKRRREQS